MTQKLDRRWVRTQDELLTAFRSLTLARGYENVTVSKIIERANVGRSTFYEHYENKDDLFRQSLHGIIKVLAETVGEDYNSDRLSSLLAHLFEKREFAVTILGGSTRNVITRYLAQEIENNLSLDRRPGKPGDSPTALPSRLVAAQIAEAQCGLLLAWLSTDAFEVLPIAQALALTSSAIASAYRGRCYTRAVRST